MAASVPLSRPPRTPLVAPSQIECHVADFTATFAADLTLAAAQEKLAEHDQWLPIDGDPAQTLDHLVSHNSTGPLRLGFGAWRDLLLGCQFRAGSDDLITAGGRTVKNVAGYDLTKFIVGQRSIFAQLVTMTTRVYKRPPLTLQAEFSPDETLVGKLLATPLRPRWAILTQNSLQLVWLDDEPAIALVERLLPAHTPRSVQRKTLAEDIAERARRWAVTGDYLRAAVPPMEVARFARLAKLQNWAADPAFGIVLAPIAAADAERIFRIAADTGGSAVCTIDGQLRYHPTAGEALLLNQLKKAFDAESKLAALPTLEPLPLVPVRPR